MRELMTIDLDLICAHRKEAKNKGGSLPLLRDAAREAWNHQRLLRPKAKAEPRLLRSPSGRKRKREHTHGGPSPWRSIPIGARPPRPPIGARPPRPPFSGGAIIGARPPMGGARVP